MADRYNRSPIFWAKRYINAVAFPTDEDRQHVLLFADEVIESTPTDPLHKAVVMRVLCDYADVIAVRSRARTETPGTDLHQQLTQQVAQINTSLDKGLRLAAFMRGRTTEGKGKRSREIFTALREKRPSELAASVRALDGGDAA